MTTMRGKILSLKAGFGFITEDEGQKNFFFYASGLLGTEFDTLIVGDRVEFSEEFSPKGPRATGIRVL